MQEPNRDLTPIAAGATVATMQREVTEPQAANRSASQAIQEFKAVLEPLARLGAILLGATYLVGFLIVMQHHATFGIVDVGVLRARVMAAGVLFDILTILPIIVVSRIYGWLGLSNKFRFVVRTRDEDRVFREIIILPSLFVACMTLAGVLSGLFIENTYSPKPWFILAGVFPILIIFPVVTKYSFDHVRKMAVLNLIGVISFGWSITMVQGRYYLWRSLWFYGCALAMRFFRGNFRRGVWRTVEWERNLGVVLALLLAFSTFIYGTVKFQFGGGAPLPMKLYLVADAPHVFEANPAKVWLVEQTAQGWYVIQKVSDHQSVFVPRALVRVIALGEDQK